jgi:hypothetical protein
VILNSRVGRLPAELNVKPRAFNRKKFLQTRMDRRPKISCHVKKNIAIEKLFAYVDGIFFYKLSLHNSQRLFNFLFDFGVFLTWFVVSFGRFNLPLLNSPLSHPLVAGGQEWPGVF